MSSVFPHFVLEKDLLKVDKILRLTFFQARKLRLRGIQNSVFSFTVVEFCGLWIVYNSRLLPRRGRFVNSASQEKFGPETNFYLGQTNLKANVCRNSTFQVNRRKNAT